MNPGRLEVVHTQRPEVRHPRLSSGVYIHLHVNDKLGVSVREASKFILVQVHDEEFISGSQFHRLPGELFVEVGGISLVSLPNGKHTHINTSRRGRKVTKTACDCQADGISRAEAGRALDGQVLAGPLWAHFTLHVGIETLVDFFF